jgi:hypothetical protein
VIQRLSAGGPVLTARSCCLHASGHGLDPCAGATPVSEQILGLVYVNNLACITAFRRLVPDGSGFLDFSCGQMLVELAMLAGVAIVVHRHKGSELEKAWITSRPAPA